MSKVVTTAVVLKRSINGDKFLDQYELIKDFECQELGEEDVLIKIEACALSKDNIQLLDDLKVSRVNQIPVGREISGTVSQVGKGVTRFNVNDQVTGIIPLDVRCSGCGNVCVLSQYDIVKKPDAVSHVDAAAVIGDAVKAFTALYYLAKVSAGETMLICNATSGFGLTTIQLAQHIGAKIIATASNEEELHFLRSLQPPIAQVIDLRFKKHSLVSICLEETGGLGIDCIIDNGVEMYGVVEDLMKFDDNENNCIPHKHDLISSLAVGGRWITRQNDLQLDPPDSRLLFLKCASVQFLFADSWTLSRGGQGKYLHILEDIMKKLSNGTLRPMVHHSVQLEDCTQALKTIDENRVGRVVMKT